MARRVYVLLQTSEEPALLAATLRGGEWRVGALDELSVKSDDDVIAFAPATEVSLLKATLPTRNDREALKIAPFSIEDDIAQSADDVFVALGPKAELNAPRTVAVVSKVTIDNWRKQLDDAGLKRAVLVPEQWVLPAQDVALDMGERILVSNGEKRFGLDGETADDLLQALIPDTATLLGAGLSRRLNRSAEALPFVHPICALAEWVEEADYLLNLFQGPYARRKPSQSIDLSSWKVPGAMAATAVFIWIAGLVLENLSYARGSDKVADIAANRYGLLFPNEGEPRNPGAAAQAKFQALGGGTVGGQVDFVTASAGLYAALEETPNVELISMRFAADDGALRAEMGYPDYGVDVALKERLETMGFQVRNGDLRQSNGRIIGDLVLGGTS